MQSAGWRLGGTFMTLTKTSCRMHWMASCNVTNVAMATSTSTSRIEQNQAQKTAQSESPNQRSSSFSCGLVSTVKKVTRKMRTRKTERPRVEMSVQVRPSVALRALLEPASTSPAE